ncbi:Uncharacterised protein [Raoultella planticola]|uniref:Uncharacterized protein n=1 Tax=Raoultella planticola TaxID=575 RepID=A0A485CXY2_RAOPL|nr:Uncharacterised protein [Raoultella planticola]
MAMKAIRGDIQQTHLVEEVEVGDGAYRQNVVAPRMR